MTVRRLLEFSIDAIANRVKFPQTCICSDRCFECNQIYECTTCELITPWCRGAIDEYEDSCDACACLLAEKAGGFLTDQILDNDPFFL